MLFRRRVSDQSFWSQFLVTVTGGTVASNSTPFGTPLLQLHSSFRSRAPNNTERRKPVVVESASVTSGRHGAVTVAVLVDESPAYSAARRSSTAARTTTMPQSTLRTPRRVSLNQNLHHIRVDTSRRQVSYVVRQRQNYRKLY